MALFGYPQAQENDAERAVRAALAIPRALEALNARNAGRRCRSSPRASASTCGPVVVDSTGEVFGEAPNVAARVQAAAAPGAALVTAAVQRQIAGLFVAEDKGAHALKGVPAAGDALSHRAGERGRAAQRSARAHALRRPRGGSRAAHAPLGARAGRRGPVRADRRRAGPRQVAARRGVPRPPRRDASHLGRVGHVAALQNTPLHPLAEWGRLRFGGADVAADKRLAELEAALAHVEARRGRDRGPARAAARHPRARGARAKTRAGGTAPPPARRASPPGFSPARARKPSCSRSRTCTGPTRPRSIS